MSKNNDLDENKVHTKILVPENISKISQDFECLEYTRAVRVTNDIVLVFAGLRKIKESIGQQSCNLCYEYNMDTNVMEPLELASPFYQPQTMKYNRASFGFCIDYSTDLIYFIGGNDENDKNLDKVEMYHFPTRVWTDLPSLNYARCNPLIMQFDNYIYAMSGFTVTTWYAVSPCFERYLKGSDHWE
mmetsp:Transcript_1954/g.1764  ORF Transcript_1954/g.1764 Transcript_1954/m.1764 type:complete len:187 (-) Transcript_1954:563-1123(-)